jgi:hypothetical protein
MLIERSTFVAKYGKGDALIDVIRDFRRQFGEQVGGPMRVATDRTGPMFTITWDMEFPDLNAWVAANASEREMFGTPEFGRWFAKMEPLVERGSRELLETVEI